MADENEQPPPSKLTRTKQRWAREGRFLTGKTSRPEEQRLPPGQHLTRDWPVLDLGLTPGGSTSKCAGIVGETMKRYHPHGDNSIYPTLARMAQWWNMRHLLITGQGNFGSIHGLP